jgi:HsdM N-terminal domain.
MIDKELKKLKDDLWHSADILRSAAHIAANKYGQPILGLIFLRYANILFKQHKKGSDAEFHSKKEPEPKDLMKKFALKNVDSFSLNSRILILSITHQILLKRPL